MLFLPALIAFALHTYQPKVIHWPSQCVSTLLLCSEETPNCNTVTCRQYVAIYWVRR